MHDTVSDGADGSFGAVMDSEFAEQTFQVSLDGVLANKQRGSDFFIASTLYEQLQYFHFSFRHVGTSLLPFGI
jgi:hypothetical protein